MRTHTTNCCCLLGLLICLAQSARAADTVEIWAVGEGDMELYSFYDGFLDGGRSSRDERAIGGELVMGWGVADRLSLMFATALTANGALTGGETGVDIAAFGTPLDTDHFDLDLIWGIGAAGEGMSEIALTPGFELNLDHSPDLATCGAYLRGGAEIYGLEAETDEVPDHSHLDWVFTLGGYWTLDDVSQLLLEYDATLPDRDVPHEPSFNHGAVALGYNRMVTGGCELITQVHLNLPDHGQEASLGVMAGFIAAIE